MQIKPCLRQLKQKLSVIFNSQNEPKSAQEPGSCSSALSDGFIRYKLTGSLQQ